MIAFLSLLIAPALATQVSFNIGVCPTDGSSVRIYSRVSGNTHGGWDSDLASYSTKGQWREYAISTCQGDLYTVYGEDMGKALTPEQQLATAARLAEIKAGVGDLDDLQIWDRYLIAADMYRIQGADHRKLAQLYLEASWTARDVAVGVYQGLEGPISARGLLDEGEKELAKPLDGRTRKILLHNLARVAHRGGFSADRDRYLKLFEEVGDLDADEARTLKEFRWIVNEVEPRLQELAIRELVAYLSQPIAASEDRMRATYLLGDLYRRRGKLTEAVQHFGAVVASEDAPEDLRTLAAWLGTQIDL